MKQLNTPIIAGAVFLLVFGLGKIFEPGPPYDDPLGGIDALQEYAQAALIPAAILLMVGLRRLVRAYKDQLPAWGRTGIWLAWIGFLMAAIGIGIYLPTRSGTWWNLMWLGQLLVAFGMILLGFAAWTRKSFPKWNGAPILIGLPLTLPFFINLFTGALENAEASAGLQVFAFLVVTGGWVLLANTEQKDLKGFHEKQI